MTTITIPKKLNLDRELIAVPRNIYEKFLIWQEMIKSRKIVKLTSAEKKAVIRGRQEIDKGEYVTLEELTYELANQNRQYRQKKS
jgi:predicted transcriptional regulator